MARLKMKRFDHELSLKTLKELLEEILSRDEGSQNINVEEYLKNLVKKPWKSKFQAVLELHHQWRF